MSIVYNPRYNMGLFGLEKLHPFDVKKFERAWKLLQSKLGPQLRTWHVDVDRPVTDEELLSVHTREHLARMRDPAALAKAFEVPAIELVPVSMIETGFLTPMRWAVRGSVIAARQALQHGVAVNLGGGVSSCEAGPCRRVLPVFGHCLNRRTIEVGWDIGR